MHAVIVNPASGGGKTARRWTAFAPKLLSRFGPCEVFRSEHPGHCEQLARAALEAGAKRIFVVGGDGTNHEVVNGLFDEAGKARAGLNRLSLTFLPMGTGSDLCRSLGLPRRPETALDVLEDQARPLDLIEVDFQGHNGQALRRFSVNIASFGISGEVGRRLAIGQKNGALSYPAAVLGAVRSYQNRDCGLTVDGGESRPARLLAGVIAKGQFFGGGMRVAPDARLDDGSLSFIELGDLSGAEVLRWLVPLYRGSHLRSQKITSSAIRELSVVPLGEAPVEIELDGEPVGQLPATFRVRHHALRVHGAQSGAWSRRSTS
ncbi:MAG: diacylglycerol kinase family protein [Myxococcota bacterium]|nr:diacylglycerol kinase family protein [Myxococcota bacterium]